MNDLKSIIERLPLWCPACRGSGHQITEQSKRACSGCGGSGAIEDFLFRNKDGTETDDE